ncbi:hypothetical protein HDE_12001 [Halotydeus destructor]|nr:hypothetical protein HDE_12001 [Halotydeus destructor]
MFGNLSVRDSLLTYQADPNIRDHSGKLAKHYEPRSKENMASKVPDIDQPVKSKHSHRHQFGPSNSHKSLSSRPSSESSLSHAAFSRIGSLNMKMKKTARALSGMKNWGSSESVNDSNLMPPPKSKGSKKKKSKTRSVSSALETVPATNEKDSDSDYGFH